MSSRSLVHRLHQFLNQPHIEILLLILAAVIILRIPNFSEPYWYGDEGIYLTIGQTLAKGQRLYVDIIDHKTPLIYYLSMVPNQFAFRGLLLGWMLVTTSAFYFLAFKWLKEWVPTIVATLIFVLLTTLPWLEGNVPNGELFMMGFVLVAASISVYQVKAQQLLTNLRWRSGLIMLSLGVLFGLAIMTKVPAIFDWAAFLALAWFNLSYQFFHLPQFSLTGLWVKAQPWLIYLVGLIVGVVLVTLATIAYFVLRGSGQAYLDYGLLYNFRYAGEFSLPFTHPLLVSAFSLPGKVAITVVFAGLLTLTTKRLKPEWPTITLWLILTLFASTLSNRPYPHYYLQLVPPLALSLGYLLKIGLDLRSKQAQQLKNVWTVLALSGTAVSLVVVTGVWFLLGFGFYPAVSYYAKYAQLVTGQISSEQYADSFNHLLKDNRSVVPLLRQSSDPYLFIWGTDPVLYAQAQKQPVGRFTVAFHTKDFQAYDETLAALELRRPHYIIVMKDEVHSFPELNQFLQTNYVPNQEFEHLILWKYQANQP